VAGAVQFSCFGLCVSLLCSEACNKKANQATLMFVFVFACCGCDVQDDWDDDDIRDEFTEHLRQQLEPQPGS
jgi:hypothetical protein